MAAHLSRRQLLRVGIGLGASAAFAPGRSRAQGGPPAPTRIRRSALRLAADDPVFQDYAQAVKLMHELPMTDGRNWRRQARIHADHCVHGGSNFLPWHRHYLNQFERICGQLINKPFALPYWDWSYDRGRIPVAFFDIPELTVEHWNDPGLYSSPNWPGIDTRPIRAIGRASGSRTTRPGAGRSPARTSTGSSG